MGNTKTLRPWRATSGAALLCCAAAPAEELVFPDGRPPVPQLASAARVGEAGSRTNLTDAQGRELTPKYDAAGRLAQRKAGSQS